MWIYNWKEAVVAFSTPSVFLKFLTGPTPRWLRRTLKSRAPNYILGKWNFFRNSELWSSQGVFLISRTHTYTIPVSVHVWVNHIHSCGQCHLTGYCWTLVLLVWTSHLLSSSWFPSCKMGRAVMAPIYHVEMFWVSEICFKYLRGKIGVIWSYYCHCQGHCITCPQRGPILVLDVTGAPWPSEMGWWLCCFLLTPHCYRAPKSDCFPTSNTLH